MTILVPCDSSMNRALENELMFAYPDYTEVPPLMYGLAYDIIDKHYTYVSSKLFESSDYRKSLFASSDKICR